MCRNLAHHANVLGRAHSNATVSLWSPESTPQYAKTTRKGEYFRGELPVNNSSAAVWMTITNLAVLNDGNNPDIVTNTVGNTFVPKTAEMFYYDYDGNLTNDGRWTYTWDAENRLARMVANTAVGPQQRIEFEYDARSRRIGKKVWNNTSGTGTPAVEQKFVYDGWNLLAVLSSSSSLLSAYTWGLDLSGSEQSAGGVGGLLMLTNSGNGTHYCAYDGNGNLAALVKATDGAVTANYEYGPFGEPLRVTGAMGLANAFRFSTKYQDDETDLLYYGYRSYNPSTGRWLSRDPIEESDCANLYALTQNDAISASDLLGMVAVRFEVVRGKLWHYPNGAGEWAQPFWSGDGGYSISASWATATVTLNNEYSFWEHNPWWDSDSWYCNTVVRGTPEGDEVGHAGTVEVFLKGNGGCEQVQFSVGYSAHLFGSGPARIYASIYAFDMNGTQIGQQWATEANPSAYHLGVTSGTVNLAQGQEKMIFRYEPVLRFKNRKFFGGVPSYSKVESLVSITFTE